MPARKKNPAARARANRASTRQVFDPSVTLAASRRPRLPQLRDSRGKIQSWHPQAREFWSLVWSSPQAATFPPATQSGLLMVALAVDRAWRSESLPAITTAAKMVGDVLEKHGLTPYGMLRLEWQFEETDAAKAQGARRRSAATPAPAAKGKASEPAPDPRRHLHSA